MDERQAFSIECSQKGGNREEQKRGDDGKFENATQRREDVSSVNLFG